MSKKIIKTQTTSERFIKLLDFKETPAVGYDLIFRDLTTGIELQNFYYNRKHIALEVNKNYYIRTICKSVIVVNSLVRTNSITTIKRLPPPWGDYDVLEFRPRIYKANQNYGIDL